MSGLRYRKRVKVAPGVHLNISRSSRGWNHSWSVKALGVNWNSRTHKRSVDLPGGLSWHEAGSKPKPRSSTKAPTATAPEPSAPYRPARWPYWLLGVLCVISMLGGAVWQAPVLFGFVALVVLALQAYWRRTRRPTQPPAQPQAPIDYEAEARRAEAEGMTESARAWRELAEQQDRK